MAACLASGRSATAEESACLAAKWQTRGGAAELTHQIGPAAAANLSAWARKAEAQHALDCFTEDSLKYATDVHSPKHCGQAC